MIVNIFESGKEAPFKWYQHKPLNSRNWKDIVKKWKKSAKIGEFCKSNQVTLAQVNPQVNLWYASRNTKLSGKTTFKTTIQYLNKVSYQFFITWIQYCEVSFQTFEKNEQNLHHSA